MGFLFSTSTRAVVTPRRSAELSSSGEASSRSPGIKWAKTIVPAAQELGLLRGCGSPEGRDLRLPVANWPQVEEPGTAPWWQQQNQPTPTLERLAEDLSHSEFTPTLPPLPSRRGALGNHRKFGGEPVFYPKRLRKCKHRRLSPPHDHRSPMRRLADPKAPESLSLATTTNIRRVSEESSLWL